MARSAANSRLKVAPRESQKGRYCRVTSNPAAACTDTLCPFPPEPQIERVFADAKLFNKGVGYCSLSEAAFAALLETLVPGFKIQEGLNFQVPMGEGRSVDFLIDGVLVEYHQPRLNPERGKAGDYRSREEYARYLKSFRRLGNNQYQRERLIEKTRCELVSNYYLRRRALIDTNPSMRDTELIVAASREEFYRKVILRFSPEPPSLGEFLARFWWWVNSIARENGLPPLRKS